YYRYTYLISLQAYHAHRDPHSFPTRRSSDLLAPRIDGGLEQIDVVHPGNLDRILKAEEHALARALLRGERAREGVFLGFQYPVRSEEHTSELQSRGHLVCRLLLEKKKGNQYL